MTISAKIIADSVSPGPWPIRLATLQLRYPKIIHGEAKTHRLMYVGDAAYDLLEEVGLMNDPALSRNASSSRAIPVERLIQDVIDDPYVPLHWGKNRAGMQASEELDDKELIYTGTDGKPVSERTAAKQIWLRSRDLAVKQAQSLSKLGAHKQIVNRLIEPFCHINVVVTATEWANFFALRRHADAQPEIHALADAIYDAMQASTPTPLKPGEWHLPYVDKDPAGGDMTALLQMVGEGIRGPDDDQWINNSLIKLSVARCARVSYLTHDNRKPNVAEDLKLYERLVGTNPLHASPCEHQATPDESWQSPHLHGNFSGWIQYRKTLPNERVADR